VWAIGTRKTATPEIAVDAHKISAQKWQAAGRGCLRPMRILYGGSVKRYATSLMARKKSMVPGGRPSLKPDSFAPSSSLIAVEQDTYGRDQKIRGRMCL